MQSNSPRVPLCLRAHAPSRRSRPRSAGAAPTISRTPYHTVYTQHRQPCGLAEFLRARRGRGLRDATWSLASIGAKQSNATQRNPYLDVADQRNDPRKHLAERAALNSQVSASTDHRTIADHGGNAVGEAQRQAVQSDHSSALVQDEARLTLCARRGTCSACSACSPHYRRPESELFAHAAPVSQ